MWKLERWPYESEMASYDSNGEDRFDSERVERAWTILRGAIFFASSELRRLADECCT